MIKEVNKHDAIAVLDAFHNNIVTVHFIKKDGTLRKITGRQGVKKYLIHRDNNAPNRRKKPDPSKFTILFEFLTKEYRMFDVERLLSFRVSGDVYIVR